uniref:serine aminopeptidase domain-containing protein n=1 Tax=Pseudomonas aeruginosa TaxID=287 RepID=UPI0020B14F1B
RGSAPRGARGAARPPLCRARTEGGAGAASGPAAPGARGRRGATGRGTRWSAGGGEWDLYRIARLIARFERWRQGPLGKSALIDFLSFGSFNKAFKPNRTAFDWLSRDPQEVDRYVADPLCGFRCSNQLWVDLLGGLADITPPTHLRQIDADLPLLVIGGERDPVSQGKRLGDLADALRGAGLRQVTLKTYPEARHELFNESNRDAVTQDLIDWLEQALRHRRDHSTKERT